MEKSNKGGKSSFKWELIHLSVYIVCVVATALLVNCFVLQSVSVNGASMKGTLYHGDRIFVEKISYRFQEPSFYDVIIFHTIDEGKDTLYVKRIIGVPGDFVEIKDGQVYVNNEHIDDPEGEETTRYAGIADGGITVGKDEYFVLGDNRNLSKDSRSDEVGLVKRSKILGKVCLRIWPVNRIGTID